MIKLTRNIIVNITNTIALVHIALYSRSSTFFLTYAISAAIVIHVFGLSCGRWGVGALCSKKTEPGQDFVLYVVKKPAERKGGIRPVQAIVHCQCNTML
jgi:hypothetical protein